MTDTRNSENYLGLVARSMAELVDRLRLSSGSPGGNSVVPAAIPRLGLAARILPELEPPACAALSRGIADLVEVLAESPARDWQYLEPALEALAAALEGLFRQVDHGADPASQLDDPVWLAVLSRLETAGTPLEVMDELDRCARQWEERWGDRSLSPEVERRLRQRWLTYREYGDAMFGGVNQEGSAPVGGEAPGTGPGELLLLLESSMRREQLQDRLRGWGYRWREVGSAQEAVARFEQGGGCLAILCDHVVPGRNLGQLVRLRGVSEHGFPLLVLITSGTGDPAVDLQRARALGADRVWTEPFVRDPLDH